LLLVIAVIGILVAILLPAVQQAREAARRTQCANNLHQLGLALTNFEVAFGSFPPAMFQSWNNVPNNYNQPPDYSNGTINQFSWMARILPYLEQAPLYNAINFAEWPFPHPSTGLPDGGFVNDRTLTVLQCPSFPGDRVPIVVDFSPPASFAFTHYLGVNGTDAFRYDGILHVNSRVRATDVKDGTSNTLLVGERPPTYDGYAGWWLAGSGWYPWFGAADVVLGTEERIAVAGETTPTGPQSHYQRGTFHFEDDGYGWDKHAWHFWSAHPDGAYFLFADGHVSFIPYAVDREMFRALGTYRGREAVSVDF
jgi:prepilin-type processing-associated H-X9-DG protein